MSKSLIRAVSGVGVTLLICSCAATPDDKDEWEFPPVESPEEQGENNVGPSGPLSQSDPFRSPDVTTSLPGISHSFKPSTTPQSSPTPTPEEASLAAPTPNSPPVGEVE